MNAPRYAVYMMLDEPHATKATFGYATAGWVVAPATGKVIARIGPMLGMLPDLQNMPAINQALAIPLEPGRPAGVTARGPANANAAVEAAARSAAQRKAASAQASPNQSTPNQSTPNQSTLTIAPTILPPAISRPAPDTRRDTRAEPRGPAPVMAVSSAAPVAAR
jgi:cell division protein FtsI (penicillin-binding protein 3)